MIRAIGAGWRIFLRLCPFIVTMYLSFVLPGEMLDDWNPPHESAIAIGLVIVCVLAVWPFLLLVVSRVSGDFVVPGVRIRRSLRERMTMTDLEWLKAAQRQIALLEAQAQPRES